MRKYLAYFLAGLGAIILTTGLAKAKDLHQNQLAAYNNGYGSYYYDDYYPDGRYYNNDRYDRYYDNSIPIYNQGIPGVPDWVIARMLRLDVSDYRNQIDNGKTLPDMIRDRGMTLGEFQRMLEDISGYGYGYRYNDRYY